MTDDVTEIEAEFERFTADMENEFCLAYTGQKPLDMSGVFARYGSLLTKEVCRDRFLGPTPSDQQRRKERLRRGLTCAFIRSTGAALEHELGVLQQTEVILIGNNVVAVQDVPRLLASEDDPDQRRRIAADYTAALGLAIAPLGHILWRNRERAAKELGWSSYTTLFAPTASEFYDLLQDMGAVVKETEKAHRGALEQVLPTLARVSLNHASHFDVSYAMRASMQNHGLSAVDPMGALRMTLNGLGVSLEDIPGLEWDLEVRPGKLPRAYTFAINPPHRIVVSCPPQGGLRDVESLLHEAGRALHFGFMDPQLPVALRVEPERPVVEAFAFLFQFLAQQPLWLAEVLGAAPDQASRIAQAGVWRRRYLARRLCGLIHHVVLLPSKRADLAQRDYEAEMARVTSVAHHPALYSVDVGQGMDPIYYFQALCLEAQLRAFLVRAFGPRWWAEPGAGECLRSWWRQGMNWTADELARVAGYDGLSATPLIEELRTPNPPETAAAAPPNTVPPHNAAPPNQGKGLSRWFRFGGGKRSGTA